MRIKLSSLAMFVMLSSAAQAEACSPAALAAADCIVPLTIFSRSDGFEIVAQADGPAGVTSTTPTSGRSRLGKDVWLDRVLTNGSMTGHAARAYGRGMGR